MIVGATRDVDVSLDSVELDAEDVLGLWRCLEVFGIFEEICWGTVGDDCSGCACNRHFYREGVWRYLVCFILKCEGEVWKGSRMGF